MQSFHLTVSASGRSALFPDEALRRRAVATLARVTGADLLLFCIVDDHVHVVVLCPEERTGRLARSLLLALRPIAGPALSPAHVRPVEGRSHLEWLVRYCIQQPARHRIGVHPALWTGSCFLDLVGARVVEGYNPRLHEALPRLRMRTVFEHAGLPAVPLEPLGDVALRRVGHDSIVAAATAALAAPPDLTGRSPLVVTCRRAITHLGVTAGLTTRQIAELVGVQPRAVRRLAGEAVPSTLLDAVRRRLALEQRIQQAAVAASPPAGNGEIPSADD